LKIVSWPIGKIKPYAKNPRKNDAAVAGVAASIREFGFRQPIVVDKGGVIIAGHTRWKAAQQLDLKQVPVHVATDLTRAQVRAYRIADNRLGELAEWDDTLLLPELGKLKLDLGDLFEDLELSSLLDQFPVDPLPGEADPDAVPEPPKKAITKLGDLWVMGNHRLLCGDATQTRCVDTLVPPERCCMMFTDPPYGVVFGSAKKNAISGDLTQAVIPISFAVAIETALDESARLYLCGGSGNYAMYEKLFDHHLQQQPHPLIWVKESFVLRPNNYHSQFEIVYFGWKGAGGGAKCWYGDRKHSDVWQFARDRDHVHPTQKPVELVARAVGNSSPPGGAIYEPFAGSGTTIIACEQLNRKCYAIEIDPRYVDTSVTRWETFTGKKAKRTKI